MILSEKASAFCIDNLISKKAKTADHHYDTTCSSSDSSFTEFNKTSVSSHDCVSPISSKYFSLLMTFLNRINKVADEKIKEECKEWPILSSPRSPKKRKLQDEDEPVQKSRPVKSNQSQLEDSEPNSITKAQTQICKGDQELNAIECFLETDDLWKKFHQLGTEMIITKSGRRMFPPLRVSFGNAKLNQKYIIAMDIVPTDSKRYRYAYHRSSWLVAGKADPPVQSRLFIHPDGPFTGDSLYKQIVSFEKVKLTNNEMDKCGHVFSFFLIYINLLILIFFFIRLF